MRGAVPWLERNTSSTERVGAGRNGIERAQVMTAEKDEVEGAG